MAILRLAHTRENPWLLPFLAFAVVLLIATLGAAPAGKWPQGLVMALCVAFMQIVTWTMIILSVRKCARRADAAISYDALPSTI
ncbi:MAG: hypothetical protein EOP82_29845 [Variovorax sp.]|nr:MAG: hypothetical protein EOP82_29845 [Variovorax sp.]